MYIHYLNGCKSPINREAEVAITVLNNLSTYQ